MRVIVQMKLKGLLWCEKKKKSELPFYQYDSARRRLSPDFCLTSFEASTKEH